MSDIHPVDPEALADAGLDAPDTFSEDAEEVTFPKSEPDVPAYAVKDAVAEVKAEYEAALADAKAEAASLTEEVVRLKDLAEKHGLEIIRLYGIIQEGVTKEVRLQATHWLTQLRAFAAAVKDAVNG